MISFCSRIFFTPSESLKLNGTTVPPSPFGTPNGFRPGSKCGAGFHHFQGLLLSTNHAIHDIRILPILSFPVYASLANCYCVASPPVRANLAFSSMMYAHEFSASNTSSLQFNVTYFLLYCLLTF